MNNLQESPARKRLTKFLDSQIVLLDGPMGTMIQSFDLSEEDFRSERFKDWEHDLKGNNDLLNITKPGIIQKIHEEFIKVGATIVETNTFNFKEQDNAAATYAKKVDKNETEIKWNLPAKNLIAKISL